MDEHPEVTYADDRVPSGLILTILAGLVLFSALLCLIARKLMVTREQRLHATAYTAKLPEAATIRGELFDVARPGPTLADEQRRLIDHYGWVDRSRKLVRIPVDRQVDLMLEKR